MIKQFFAGIIFFTLSLTQSFALDANPPPPKFPIPWGNNAGAAYIRSIPTASQIGVTNGAASLTDGFPPLTFVPVGAGGTPPFGQDFNGIFNQITQWTQRQATGAFVPYDAPFSSSIGGYPQNSILTQASNPGSFWISTVDNNTTNPDAGGANWVGFSLSNWVNEVWHIGAATTGTASAYVTTLTPPVTAGQTNFFFTAIITSTNVTVSGSTTINFGLGSKVIVDDKTNYPIVDGTLPGGVAFVAIFYYDGIYARLINVPLTPAVIGLLGITPPRNLISQTTHGTYAFTVPTNTYWIYVTDVGAGGGGGGGAGTAAWSAGGGGAGGTAEGWIAVTPGQIISYTVGQGGAGGPSSGGEAANGGNTTILSYTGFGGQGGFGSSATSAGGSGATASGGQLNLIGGVGGEGNNNTFTTPGGGGGSSSLGGGGRTSTISLSVVNGQAPGSGGGGIYGEAGPAANGGIGADGAVIIQY